MHATPDQAAEDARALDLLMPIQFFYLRDNRLVPPVEFIEGGEMPEPYAKLLVHQSDMTPRLGAFHKSEIGLDVLDHEESREYLMRAVVLRDSEGKPVEFGAIGIRLEVFNESLRKQIVNAEGPLGGLLAQHDFPHSSSPKAYFSVIADQYIADQLACQLGTVLYGRCNALLGNDGITFADIVEILPNHGQ
ncbi:MAG: chorismate-pyruvate lyase [Verrucomicrobiales bacterium]|jgi:chorismate-pyruvate lyase